MLRKILVTGGSGFIGTHLVDALAAQNVPIVNLDIRSPHKKEHLQYWKQCDLLEPLKLRQVLHDIGPTEILHLAARTDTIGTTLDDYRANTQGTANLLEILEDLPNISRVIITSTQFVHRPGKPPQSDTDFNPHTIYGRSKVLGEQLTRAANLKRAWTIVRPTTIWGPWHPRYPKEFWKVLKNGLYIHPGKKPVLRSYGYVKNAVSQMEQILDTSPETINKKVFYLGDRPGPILEWINAFSKALTGREVRIVPRNAVRVLARVGDLLLAMGVPVPIYTSRFQSMTEDYLTPMESTFATFGAPPYSLEEGVKETIMWLRSQSDFWT